MNTPMISILVPVWNEENVVTAFLKRLLAIAAVLAPRCEIIVIDDGSTDGTRAALEHLQQEHPALHVTTLREHAGKTAALAAGRTLATGETIVLIDGDLQYDPADIPRLLAALGEGRDGAIGRRTARPGDAWLTRQWPSQIANRLVRCCTGVRLHDAGTGLQAYRRDVFARLPLQDQWHRFLPVLAALDGAAVTEVPIQQTRRSGGRSKYGLERVPVVFCDLLRLARMAGHRRRAAAVTAVEHVTP